MEYCARCRWLFALVAALAAAACYELPPRIPEGYAGGSPQARGWPAPAVYDLERSHPRNRWFQRAFAERDDRGELQPVPAWRPLPCERKLSRVDLAEERALVAAAFGQWGSSRGLERIGGQDRSDSSDRMLWAAIVASDLLQAALTVRCAERSEGEGELVAALVEASRAVSLRYGLTEEAFSELAEPPPLREGTWFESEPLEVREFLPSARDLRWTRVLSGRKGGASDARVLVLRLRVALDASGAPLLLCLPSECLEFTATSRERLLLRRWFFDRERWLRGEEPWITTSLEDETDPACAVLSESSDARPYAPCEGGPWKSSQRAHVTRILREALSRAFESCPSLPKNPTSSGSRS